MGLVMGITTVSATITNVDDRTKTATGKFLVDTGAGYTVVPQQMVKKLGIRPTTRQEFSLADGTTVSRKLGYAFIKVDFSDQKKGIREAPSMVVIGEKSDDALFGTLTLEQMGLLVDPFKRTLRPMKLMLG